MRAAAEGAFWAWTIKHEGRVPWPYLDIYGLPTTGVGNLLSTPAESVMLPWKRADGSLASRDEIIADWATIKASGCGVYRQLETLPNGTKRHKCAWRGTGKTCTAHQGHLTAKPIAKLRLTDADIETLVMNKLASNERVQVVTFGELWPTLCADAQLAVHSMAWAIGAHWPTKFPKLAAALRAGDYRACAVESKLREVDNPGVVGRNKDVRVMFGNAHNVALRSLDPEVLYFPRNLDTEYSEADTEPDLDVYRAEGPSPIVRLMPETVQPCAQCGLVSCAGECPGVG